MKTNTDAKKEIYMRHMRRLGEQSRGVGTRSRLKEETKRQCKEKANRILDRDVSIFFDDVFAFNDDDDDEYSSFINYRDFRKRFMLYIEDYIKTIYTGYTDIYEENNNEKRSRVKESMPLSIISRHNSSNIDSYKERAKLGMTKSIGEDNYRKLFESISRKSK